MVLISLNTYTCLQHSLASVVNNVASTYIYCIVIYLYFYIFMGHHKRFRSLSHVGSAEPADRQMLHPRYRPATKTGPTSCELRRAAEMAICSQVWWAAGPYRSEGDGTGGAVKGWRLGHIATERDGGQ